MVDAREYALALDLAAMLASDKITITGQERGDIAALAVRVRMDPGPSFCRFTSGQRDPVMLRRHLRDHEDHHRPRDRRPSSPARSKTIIAREITGLRT